jgi:hypothetical protein
MTDEMMGLCKLWAVEIAQLRPEGREGLPRGNLLNES